MITKELETSSLPARINALRKVGVPYPADYERQALPDLEAQAEEFAARLKAAGVEDAAADKEIIALIAYLQRLGTDIRAEPKPEEPAAEPKAEAAEPAAEGDA